MVREMKILFVAMLTSLSFVALAQERIQGISPCVDSVVNASMTHTIHSPVKFKIIGKKIIFVNTNLRDTFDQENVFTWLNSVEQDSIKEYQLKDAQYKCFILSSKIKQATGLGSNFMSWLIIIPKANEIYEFESLSQNPKLIFLNTNNKRLSFVKITYGDFFFWKRDWNNVDYQIEFYEIDNRVIKLIRSINTWCLDK